MLTLSKFVWPSTSKSASISTPVDKFENLTRLGWRRNLSVPSTSNCIIPFEANPNLVLVSLGELP